MLLGPMKRTALSLGISAKNRDGAAPPSWYKENVEAWNGEGELDLFIYLRDSMGNRARLDDMYDVCGAGWLADDVVDTHCSSYFAVKSHAPTERRSANVVLFTLTEVYRQCRVSAEYSQTSMAPSTVGDL